MKQENSFPDPARQANARMRKWLVITFILLAFMALFSALGSFFVRVFLVGAIFTFWQVVQSWRDLNSRGGSASYGRSRTRPSEKRYSQRTTSSLRVELLWQRFNAWPIHKKIGISVWLFTMFIFFLIFATTIFSVDDSTDYASTADYYYETGNQFYYDQSYDSAYMNYKKALALRPEFPEALYGYANTLYTRNYPDSSIYYYDKAVEMDPHLDDARYNKAWVYFQLGKYDKAIETLAALLDNNPSYYAGAQLMGDIYYEKNEHTDALFRYQQAYDGGMRGGLFCERMAYIYETKGERDRAVELYKEAVYYDDTLIQSYRRLGELVPGEEGSAYRQRANELQ